jgi:threonine-phosphate decarboxylase
MFQVTHGGRALRFAREHNINYRDVLDFSANINPLGPSPRAMQAVMQALERIRVYPDENAMGLIRALADRLNVAGETILPGNGATELLYFWLRSVRPRTATLVVPTFTEYRKALESVGTQIQTVELHPENHFRLPRIDTDADVVIVTNPNNPAGSYAPPEEMCDWIIQFKSPTQVFIDEAFVEFTAQPSLVRYLERFPNLWVLRSMTKFYALPGLRLGYLVGSATRALVENREPWQVNVLAEVAGIASLEDRDHEEATMQLIQRERIWFWKQLQTISRIRAFPTAANFFLAQADEEKTLELLLKRLSEDNILVRDCRSTEGMNGSYFRFAIKTRSENERLLRHLRSL